MAKVLCNSFKKADSNLHCAMLLSPHLKYVPDLSSLRFQTQYTGKVALQDMTLVIYSETL